MKYFCSIETKLIKRFNSVLASTNETLPLYREEMSQFSVQLEMNKELEEYWYKEKGERYIYEVDTSMS